MPNPERPKTLDLNARPAIRGRSPAMLGGPGPLVADPGDLVARALAILAEETAAWTGRSPEDSPPPGSPP